MSFLLRKRLVYTVLLTIGSLLSVSTVFSQARRTIKIASVSIEGNKTADPNFIKLNSGFSEGDEISGEDIQKAIKQLWSLQLFSDIQVILDKEVAGEVYLRIQVAEYPRLSKVELNGNKKLKKKEIEKKLDFYKGQVLSPQSIRRSENKMKELYREKGFLLAEVSSEMREDERKDRKALRFKIKEGNKVRIKGIAFHGNKNFPDKKLRGQFKETEEDGFLFLGGGDFDPEKYNDDQKLLIEFYNKEGFRDAEVVRDSIYYGPKKKKMFIDVWVEEGIRYYFGKLAWEGNELYTSEQLKSFLDFESGDVYNREKIQKAVFERVGNLYYDSGYIYASVTPQETPVGKDTVDILFRVHEGSAVKVNKINIVGNTKTKEKVIRRALRIHPGDTFSREALMRSQREIFVLNYFGDVRPDVQPLNDEEVDILLEVEEKSTDTANMSAGFSERDKLIGSIGLTMNNFFGNGQTLSLDWNFGRAFRSFQIGFTEPWLMDSPTLVGFSFFDIKRNRLYTGYDYTSRGATARLGRRLRWPDNFFRADWIYGIKRDELSNFIESFQNSFAAQQDWPLTVSSLSQIITRNSLNRPEFPTEGSRFTISTEVAGGFLGGNVNFHKHLIQNEWFSPAFFNLVLFNNIQVGYIESFGEDLDDIPYTELFFIGGEGLSRSIPLRGYNDPLSNGGLGSSGGKVMFKYGTELRVPISPNPTIFGLAFAEAGNTWLSLRKTDLYDLRRSVGIGMRIFMPMLGIIGFDYAYGFDNIDPVTGRKFGDWKPHFVFGRSF